jgi:hypothetical protein
MTTTKEAAMSSGTQAQGWVELADRQGDGLDIRLLWNRADGRVKVTVTRLVANRVAELQVAPDDALEAFHHPFAYRRPAPVHRHSVTAEAIA